MGIVRVITWRYLDHSASGVIGAFDDLELADMILKLLNEHGDTFKEFSAHNTGLLCSGKEGRDKEGS